MVQLREGERERDSAKERGDSGFGEGAITPHLQLPGEASPCLAPTKLERPATFHDLSRRSTQKLSLAVFSIRTYIAYESPSPSQLFDSDRILVFPVLSSLEKPFFWDFVPNYE